MELVDRDQAGLSLRTATPSTADTQGLSTWGRAGRRPVLLLAGVAFVDGVDKGILPGVLSLVQDDLGFSDTQAGVLGSVFVLMTFVVVLPAGYIADRFRRTSIIAITLASWGLIAAVNAAVRNFWQFVVVRAALGVGETVDNPASQSLISDYYPVGIRGRAFAYQRVAPTLGNAIGLGIGGAVGAVFGWRAAFLLVGIPGSFLAVAMWRLREPTRGETDAPGDEAVDELFAVDSGTLVEAAGRRGIDALRRDLSIALRVRSLRAVMVGAAVSQGATAGFAFWMPTFYERHTSLSQASAAAALGGLMLLGALAGTVVGGRLNDQLRRTDASAPMALAGTSQLIAGVVIAGSFVPGLPAALILVAHLIGTALLVGAAPALLATMTEIVPARIRGISFAVATFLGALMAAASPLLIGVIADQFTFVVDGETKGHLGHAFLVVTPLVLVAGRIVLAGRRHVRADVLRVPELDAQLAAIDRDPQHDV